MERFAYKVCRINSTRVLEMITLIKIDATTLANLNFMIPGLAEALAANTLQPVQLEPGRYSVQTHTASDTSWQFEVTPQGLVDYAPILDASGGGFLTGRGSTTLGIVGFTITMDGTKLATRSYFLNGVTTSLDSTQPQPLNLLPGRYQFYQGNNDAVPEADFEVGIDGQVHFASNSDVILKWRDAERTLEIVGFPITLDGRGLAVISYYLGSITKSLESQDLQPLRLLPGRYRFYQGNNDAVPEADFEVDIDGKVDYAPERDVAAIPPGPLSGRRTDSLRLVGFRILVDASAFAGVAVVLLPFGVAIDTVAPEPQPVSLLPNGGLSLELRTADPKTAFFDLTGGGRVVLDDPYPFVEIRWRGWEQVVRLSADAIRQKRECCVALASVDE